jgi:hypothetical protein
MRLFETVTGAEKGSTMASTRTQMTWRKTFFLFCSIGALLASFAFAGGASAMRETASTAPSIVSDKADYNPGSTVTLTGANWGSGEAVHINVNDDVGQTWKLDADVAADADGNFTYQFTLPNFFVADYNVTATGASGQVATAAFTDAVQFQFSGKDTSPHGTAATEEDLGTVSAGTAVAASCPSGLEVKVTGLGSSSLSWAISYVSAYGNNSTLSSPSSRTTISPQTGTFSGNGTECVSLSVSTTGLAAGTYHGELQVARTGGASATTEFYFFKFTVNSTTSTTTTSIARTTGTNPSTYGDALTFTATVTGSAGNPSGVGTVTFKDGTTVVCNAVSLTGNTAPCSPSLGAGGHSLTAEYSGATGFTASTSSPLPQTVNQKPVTGSFTTPASKVYDGNTTAAVLTRVVNGAIGGDAVSLSGGTASFANKDVGTNKTVTLVGAVLAGADKDNYSLGSVGTETADITVAPLDINAEIDSKVYDGTTSSSAVPTLGSGQLQGGDTVTGRVQAFQSKNVLGASNSILVVTAYTVNDGNSGGNYDVATHQASGTITTALLDVNAAADAKEYDRTTSSSAVPTLGSGQLKSGDTVTGRAQAFQSKNVLGTNGSTLVVTAYTVNDGNSGGNYNVSTHTIAGTITKKALTVTGITAGNKPWDGNTSATLNTGGATLNGVISPDDVSLDKSGATGAFANSNVGTWTVQISGLALSGTDKGNYSLTQPTTTASIGAWFATGFYQPIGPGESKFVSAPGAAPAVDSNTTWNTAKGGSTIPLKFNLYTAQGGAERTNTADISGFDAVKLGSCSGSGTEDPVDFVTTGSTSLRYDGTGQQFIQNWKTPSVNGDTCYRSSVKFLDGSAIYAFVKLKK